MITSRICWSFIFLVLSKPAFLLQGFLSGNKSWNDDGVSVFWGFRFVLFFFNCMHDWAYCFKIRVGYIFYCGPFTGLGYLYFWELNLILWSTWMGLKVMIRPTLWINECLCFPTLELMNACVLDIRLSSVGKRVIFFKIFLFKNLFWILIYQFKNIKKIILNK
jgi:hypothetical protein